MKVEWKVGITWVFIITVFMVWDYNRPYDDTDNKQEKIRSGFSIMTDHGSGCQYLTKLFAGLTPRIDSDGVTHMGCRF